MKTKQTIIGIDIGRAGGVCVLSEAGILLLLPFGRETKKSGIAKIERENDAIISNLSTIESALNTANGQCGNTRILIEHIYAISKVGAASMVTFGRHAGSIFGYLHAKGHTPQTVRSTEWKKELGLIGKGKDASIALAKELYPGADLRRTYRCTTESDGLAEALLIAHYGMHSK